jgi:hypothetical protein
LFNRIKPGRIVVDSVKSSPSRIFIEAAYQQRIPIDYIWHAPFVLQNLRFEALGCDSSLLPRVTRVLSWGEANDRWLDVIGARVERVRVGNPILGRYARVLNTESKALMPSVLLLQYTPVGTDPLAVNSLQYSFFVEAVQMLGTLGYRGIGMKVHPGLWRKDYYERVARSFGLDVALFKDEPFDVVLRRFDIVIGPAASGAMLETLAAGKPYYPTLLPPHTFDTSYVPELPIFDSVEALRDAIVAGRCAPRQEILNLYCACAEVPDPARRIYELLRADLEGASVSEIRHAA